MFLRNREGGWFYFVFNVPEEETFIACEQYFKMLHSEGDVFFKDGVSKVIA